MVYIDRVQTEYLILSKPHKMREGEMSLEIGLSLHIIGKESRYGNSYMFWTFWQ